MATITKEIIVNRDVEQVWDAIRDVGALHTRLVPGFVVDTRLEGDGRIVTFANGLTVLEKIVTLDDDARRLVWTATGGLLTHHNGSVKVNRASDSRSHIVWVADILPDSAKQTIDGMMSQGIIAMRTALDQQTRG
jgi:hypothetical protein